MLVSSRTRNVPKPGTKISSTGLVIGRLGHIIHGGEPSQAAVTAGVSFAWKIRSSSCWIQALFRLQAVGVLLRFVSGSLAGGASSAPSLPFPLSSPGAGGSGRRSATNTARASMIR